MSLKLNAYTNEHNVNTSPLFTMHDKQLTMCTLRTMHHVENPTLADVNATVELLIHDYTANNPVNNCLYHILSKMLRFKCESMFYYTHGI